MDFALTEEQQELSGLAARILDDRMTLQHLKERDRSDDWYDLDTWREFATANLLGIALPESVGGLGMGFLDLCTVVREVGRHVAPLPVIPTLVSAALPIARFGTDAQSAMRCPTAWNVPICRSNCLRSVVYFAVRYSARSATPDTTAHVATVVRFSAKASTSAPWPAAPSTASSPTRTPSSRISNSGS